MSGDVKGFYDEAFAGESLGTRLAPPTGAKAYHLKVTEYEVDTWDDGRPRLNLSTEVVCGEFAGMRGPRHTLSLGESRGEVSGRSFTITAEDSHKRLRVTAKAIFGSGQIKLTNPTLYDTVMLEDVGAALVGKDFVGVLYLDKNGYDRIRTIFSMSEPPKKFQDECNTQGFSLPLPKKG